MVNDMKKKLFLLISLFITSIPFINASCHAELENNTTFNVGDEIIYNLGSAGNSGTIYGIHYEIQYDPNVLDPDINNGVKSYYNWENISKEIISNDGTKYNTIILDITTKDKSKYITKSYSVDEFIKLASIKFNVKDTDETSTKLSLLTSEIDENISFKYIYDNDFEKVYETCTGQINTFIKIKKVVDPILTSITIDGVELENFSSDKYEYEYIATSKTVDLRATTKNNITISGVGKKELIDGENEFIITVSNEDNTTNEYKIIIKYDSTDESCDIKNIKIDNYEIKFDPNTLEYKLKIKDEYSLNIDVTLVNEESKFIIKGNQNLQNNSKIIIEVRNGVKSKKYNIIIEKEEEAKIVKKTSTKLIIFIVISIILIISFVLFLVIKNKKKKENKDIDNNDILEEETLEDEFDLKE